MRMMYHKLNVDNNPLACSDTYKMIDFANLTRGNGEIVNKKMCLDYTHFRNPSISLFLQLAL